MRFLSWLVVYVVALAAATWLVDGIAVTAGDDSDRVVTIVLVGAILGVITSFVKPVVTFLALPLVLLTLGLFLLVINALLLMLTGALADQLDLAFTVDGFGSAFLGSIVISVVSWLVGALLPDPGRAVSVLPPLPAPRQPGAPYRIGLVCLGNICRSPMADVVLSTLVDRAGLSDRVMVASCGTGGWHVGEPMDRRAAATLVAEDYDPSAHRAQQLDAEWLTFDLLLAMDEQNLDDVRELGGGDVERVRLFRDYDRTGSGPVPDPYYGGPDGFAQVLGTVERTCLAVVAGLEQLLPRG